MAQTPAQPSTQRLDEKNGLKEAHFGAPLSSFSNLKLYSNDGASALYRPKMPTLQVGIYHLYNVTYSFYKQRLMAIICSTGDADNTAGIKRVLIAAYGRPVITSISTEWKGKKVELQMLDMPKGRLLTMSSIAIVNQRSVDAVAAGKQAAGDL